MSKPSGKQWAQFGMLGLMMTLICPPDQWLAIHVWMPFAIITMAIGVRWLLLGKEPS